jgi:hypothetical protein
VTDGIYTVANDTVYDELVAFLNSVERNAGGGWPVCVIPYDDRIDLVRREVEHRDNVFWFDDAAAIQRWEQFVTRIWATRPDASESWRRRLGVTGVHRIGMHRRFCAFDGPFERFIYFDADILLMEPADRMFERLADHDFVTYDDQFKGPRHVFNLESPKLDEVFGRERVAREIFCAAVFASKRGLFDEARRRWLLSRLEEGESAILYIWAPVNATLNYMVMRSGVRGYNFFLELPPDARAETCVTSPQFEERDGVLYDRGTRLPYLHYIGIPADAFNAVCRGRNVGFPYRELFLRYRYLREPDRQPRLVGRSRWYYQPPGRLQRARSRLRRWLRSLR